MTITKEKTWGKYHHGWFKESSVDETNRTIMFAIKTGLIATYDGSGVGGAGAWSVVGSCDSLAAGIDAVDRWVDRLDLVWGTGAHSWIVLKQTGISATDQGFQLLIDLRRTFSQSENCSMYISYSAGFTGGSTTARPTATDETTILDDTRWGGGTTVNYTWSVSVAKTSDGSCTRTHKSYDGNVGYNWW